MGEVQAARILKGAASGFDPSPVERELGLAFRDPALLERALTHKSFAYEDPEGQARHNESLEFLGDAVLGLLITDLLYRNFPDWDEGRKSKTKAHLVSAATLSKLALKLGLPEHLRLGRGEEKTGGRRKMALAANAFEAVLGAVYLDGGLDSARSLINRFYADLISAVQQERVPVEDPKTALQEFLQGRDGPPPRYVVANETGPQHKKIFHIELFLGNRKLASASGSTKKQAERRAARDALDQLLSDEKPSA